MSPPPAASQSLASTREKRQTRPTARIQEMREQEQERKQERERKATTKTKAKPKENPKPENVRGNEFMYGPAESFIEPTLTGDSVPERERHDALLAEHILKLLAHRGDGDWSAHYAEGGPVDLRLLQQARDYPGARIIENALDEARLKEEMTKAKDNGKGKARAIDLDDQAPASGQRPTLYSGITIGRTPEASPHQDHHRPFLGYPSRSLSRSRSPPSPPPLAKKPRLVTSTVLKPAVSSAALRRPVTPGTTSGHPQVVRRKTSYGGPSTRLKLASAGSRPLGRALTPEPNNESAHPTLTNPTRPSADHDRPRTVLTAHARHDDRSRSRSLSPTPPADATQKRGPARVVRIPWAEPVVEFIPEPPKRPSTTNTQAGRKLRPVPPPPANASQGDYRIALGGSRTSMNPRPVPPAPSARSADPPCIPRVASVGVPPVKNPRPVPPPLPPNGPDLSDDALAALDAQLPTIAGHPRPVRTRAESPQATEPRMDRVRTNKSAINQIQNARSRANATRISQRFDNGLRASSSGIGRRRVEVPRANKARGQTARASKQVVAKHMAPANRRARKKDARPANQVPRPPPLNPVPNRREPRPQNRAHQLPRPHGSPRPPQRLPLDAQRPPRPRFNPDDAQEHDGSQDEAGRVHERAFEDEETEDDDDDAHADDGPGPNERVNNRPTIGSFPFREQKTVKLMARKAKAWIIACGTFSWTPNDAGGRVPTVERIVARSFAEACREHGRALRCHADHIICVQNLVTTYRTSVKIIIVALVKLRIDFVAGAKAYNRALVKWLLPDAFHELYPEGRGDRHPFESRFIFEAVACVLFDPGVLGIKHAARFNPVPLRFLAFICAVCNHVIKCYRRGYYNHKEHLKASTQESAFHGYLELLSEMSLNRREALKDICELMYEEALTKYRQDNQEVPEARPARQWDPDVPARPQHNGPAPTPRDPRDSDLDDDDVASVDGVEDEDGPRHVDQGRSLTRPAREISVDDGTNHGEGPSRPYGVHNESSEEDDIPSPGHVVSQLFPQKVVPDDETEEPSGEEMEED